MEFHPCMRGSVKQPPARATQPFQVSSVFLNHYVGNNFRSTEKECFDWSMENVSGIPSTNFEWSYSTSYQVPWVWYCLGHHHKLCSWTYERRRILAYWRVASKRFKVPTALTSKSSKGIEVTLSWDSWECSMHNCIELELLCEIRDFWTIANIQVVVGIRGKRFH